MSEELSLNTADEKIDLQNNKTDRFVTWLKSGGGIVPLGSSVIEHITTAIPNQRLDRIVRFIEVLNQKLQYIQEDVLQLKLKSGEFTELFAEVLNQASKTNSDDRREYLASLLKNSLSDEGLELIEKEKLLQLLGQINDAEAIFLKRYSLHVDEDDEFEQKHGKVLGLIPSDEFLSQRELEKGALRKAYINKLIELGLVRETYKTYKIVKTGDLPEFDLNTGKLKAAGYTTTALGLLLLRYIDQYTDQAEYQFQLQLRSR